MRRHGGALGVRFGEAIEAPPYEVTTMNMFVVPPREMREVSRLSHRWQTISSEGYSLSKVC